MIEIVFYSVLPWLALFVLELILGLQNVLVIDLFSDRASHPIRMRWTGLVMALLFRMALLFGFFWLGRAQWIWFDSIEVLPSLQNFVYICGGAILLYRSCIQLLWPSNQNKMSKTSSSNFARILLSIVVANVVFSMDSILIASSLIDNYFVAISAIISAMAIVVLIMDHLSVFLERRVEMKTMALAFVALLGLALFLKGLGFVEELTWIYPMLGFALVVEFFNVRQRAWRRIQENWRDSE